MREVKTLTESTLIPISAIGLIFGAAAWVTTIYKQGEANAKEIAEIKDARSHDIEKIEVKLDRINDKLDRLIERK